MDAIDASHLAFLSALDTEDLPELPARSCVESDDVLLAIYRSQCLSRHLDRTARMLQKNGQAYYTIGSSGHEGMAAVAEALRPTDMAFLHYRDGAFQIQRAIQEGGPSALREIAWDMLLSFTASSEDPISGGRHKVLGSAKLNIPPQTSTIASHLPKSVGAAYGLGLTKRLKLPRGEQAGSDLIVCSFGDASVNHSTAQGAFNAAAWAAYQSAPLPLLFVCEDNGIGISVKTPEGWVARNFSQKPGLQYFAGNGLDVLDALDVARKASGYARQHRRPAFLHLRMVRLFGHAGSDVEAAYRDSEEILREEACDPLRQTVSRLVEHQIATVQEAQAIYVEIGEMCAELAVKAVLRPKLTSRDNVVASLVPPPNESLATSMVSPQIRKEVFGREYEALATPQTMGKLINWALTDILASIPNAVVAGEDVGRKGGVYGATRGLQKRFGQDRVIDTLLDEQSVLGLAIGLAQTGFLPIPEIQFLAYLHNAEDQLRGEAATLPFFSDGQYTNPMVVRVAGLGYQRGFGGHFHNDNSLAVLRDIPGIVIACPSNGPDAVRMLRGAVQLAVEEQRVVVFLEPIAIYQLRDLLVEEDGLLMGQYPEPGETLKPGQLGRYGDGKDIAIVTYGNGVVLSRRAAHRMRQDGIEARVIDLRWLAPLAESALLDETDGCGAILIVDECRKTGSQSEALMALFAEQSKKKLARVTAMDCFIPTGPAYAATLPSENEIVIAGQTLFSTRA